MCSNPKPSVPSVKPSGQNKDNSQAPASSPKRMTTLKKEGSGIGSLVVEVAVNQNEFCFDVCISYL
jgi:hypothetical protein